MRPCVILLLLFLTLSPPLRAQTDDAPTPKLSAALAAARPPSKGLTVTVNAENIYLWQGATNPRPRFEAGQIADAFGRATRRFGSILALAPPSMFVFNSNPGDADPFAGFNSDDAFKLLAADLSDSQWKQLTSDSGLGVGDLTSARQRALFAAFVPDGPITVYRDHSVGDERFYGTRDLASGAVRLRVGVQAQLWIPVKGKSGSHEYTESNGSEDGWKLQTGSAETGARQYGVTLRESVPNTPKRGNLDFDAPQFGVGVGVKNVKTVGELVTRIGQATKTEIYADVNWEKKSVTISGAAATEKASDLLRALAFCLTGTYRKIGPAYVLTENSLGRGTQHQIWSNWARKVEISRLAAKSEAEKKLAERHAARNLGDLPGTLSLSAAQRRQAMRAYVAPEDGPTFDTLTPQQQTFVREQIAENDAERKAHPEFADQQHELTTDGKFDLHGVLVLQLTAPDLETPVTLTNFNMTPSDFDASADADNMTPEDIAKRQKETDDAIARTPPQVNLTTLLQSVPKRAVLAAPRNVKDLDALLLSMKSLGFNQLWLDVFSGGVAHLPGVPMSDAPLDSDAGPDILDLAITKGRKLGISVFASLDLLRWGKNPPAPDLSVSGETSPVADSRERANVAAESPEMLPEFLPSAPMGVFVSPLAPGVRESLTDLIHAVAVRPNLAGLVWRETAARGYVVSNEVSPNSLGYSEPVRLAFLRQAHVDPIDLTSGGQETFDITLRGGTSDGLGVSYVSEDTVETDQAMTMRWQKFLQTVNLGLMRSLWHAVPPATLTHPRLPIVVRQRQAIDPHDFNDDWYGSWDAPNVTPPVSLPLTGYSGPDSQLSAANPAMQARRSRQNFFLVPPSVPFTDAAAFAQTLQWRLQNGKWRGLVLDVTGEETENKMGAKMDENPLAKLAASAAARKRGANAGK